MSPPPPPWEPPPSNQCAAPGLLLTLPAEPTAAPPSLWTRPLARSNLRPHGQMSARDQGPAGAPRRRYPEHHGYSSWPPFAASSSSNSGRRRWPLCLEPLHPLHRAGALARAQAPDRRPRVSLSDFDLAGRRSHDKADPAASRGQPRGARALREQRSHSSCSFAMAASVSRPAASLPRRRARRRRAARLAPCPAFLFFSFLSFSDLSPSSLTSLSLSRCNAPMAARSSPLLAPAPPDLAAVGNGIATLGSDPDAHPRPPSAASPRPGLPCGAPPRAQPKAGPLFLR